MKKLQKMGGVAALYAGAAFLVAMVGYLVVLDTLDVVDPVQKVASFVDNQAVLYVLNLISYIVWGIFMAVLALALNERLKASSPAWMQIATVIGLIWSGVIIASGMISNIGMATVVDLYGKDPAQAATVWLAVGSVADGLGGVGGEILGGTWILLVSWVALRAKGLPSVLNYLGVLLGVMGILSTVPALFSVLGIVFGLGKIVWYLWLGIVMLRSRPSAA